MANGTAACAFCGGDFEVRLGPGCHAIYCTVQCQWKAAGRRRARSASTYECVGCGSTVDRGRPTKGQPPKWCDACRDSRRYMKVPVSVRREVYERDGWVCQICMDPVDPSLPAGDPWRPSIDHIECRSWTGSADDSIDNLRLAHKWCNSVRGDERYYTAADLRSA